MSDPLLQRLRQLDACTTSDALERVGLTGAVAKIRPVWTGASAAGRVITMSVVSADGRAAPRHLGAAAIDVAQPGDIIVIERRDPHPEDTSSWGGLLALAASRRQVGGVIVDGACRDVDEIRELGLPVWSRGVVPFTARRRVIEESVGAPIQIAGMRVASGDFVVADGSGICFIAGGDLERVLDAAEDIARREELMAADIRGGAGTGAVLGKSYEELLDG